MRPMAHKKQEKMEDDKLLITGINSPEMLKPSNVSLTF